ncbi:MAG: gamma-glutamylcyclotransferase [Burkholderiales bacterium]|nr:gamma-glutamylcyclotransferase [Burkholderiales bacterium]
MLQPMATIARMTKGASRPRRRGLRDGAAALWVMNRRLRSGTVMGVVGERADGEDRWVFGYGSLMWRPGFPFIERRTAVLHVKIDGNGKVKSLVFLSDMKHGQWAGALSLEQQAELIAGAQGLSGRNIDYLRDLVLHLREDGVRDHAMETLLKMVEAREGVQPSAAHDMSSRT